MKCNTITQQYSKLTEVLITQASCYTVPCFSLGEPKMLPMQTKQRGTFFFYGILPLFHVLFTQMEGIMNLQKKLKFFYTPRWRKSPGGIDIGPFYFLIWSKLWTAIKFYKTNKNQGCFVLLEICLYWINLNAWWTSLPKFWLSKAFHYKMQAMYNHLKLADIMGLFIFLYTI